LILDFINNFKAKNNERDNRALSAMMAWNGINDVIDELLGRFDIESNHHELNVFKSPIAKAIATMRSERACFEKASDRSQAPRARHATYITNECLKDDTAALF
jgi:hypothetical protein